MYLSRDLSRLRQFPPRNVGFWKSAAADLTNDLAQCQSPLGFLMRHGGFRGDFPACLLLGIRHGLYCIGCCWVLMALLFVGGVMNVLWIALLALLVLLEKMTPFGVWIARAAGVACIAAGAGVLFVR